MAEEPSESQNVKPSFGKIPLIGIAVLLGLVALGILWWKSAFDSRIHFLPARNEANWIVFPSPPSPLTRQTPESIGIFRRSFVLERAPDYASISLLAFRDAAIVLNGQLVDLSKRDAKNWKKPTLVAAPKLRVGTNEISVTVTNQLGPPALNLLLQSGDFKLRTDENWHVSLVGSAWRPAKIASTPTSPGKGNPLAGGENSLQSITRVWPWLIVATTIAGVLAASRQKIKAALERYSPRQQLLFFAGVIALIWTALFVNNLRGLPWNAGFDSEDHIKYIEYILKNKSLPLASDGWEMFQPPLYYLLGALAVKITGLAGGGAVSDGGIILLRCFGLLLAIAQSLLVLLTFRFLFPNDLRKQLFGFVLAAFLPAQIYLAHYISNENLMTLLVVASICTCAYIFRRETFSTSAHVLLGILIGLALLAKVTALIAGVAILAALAGRLIAKRNFSAATWFRTIGLAVLGALVICGWHYLRVWKNYGTPFIGNWDEALGWHWWQYEGFRTSDYYFRFGRALVEPLFSGVESFADGLYSTLWADGLCGGRAAMSSRPPWNYEVMAVGCLLALAAWKCASAKSGFNCNASRASARASSQRFCRRRRSLS